MSIEARYLRGFARVVIGEGAAETVERFEALTAELERDALISMAPGLPELRKLVTRARSELRAPSGPQLLPLFDALERLAVEVDS